jgi:signal transduction histidine kinase
MTRTGFSLNVLHISVAAIVFLPAYIFLYLHPSFTNTLISGIEKEAQSIGEHLSAMLPESEIELKRSSVSDDFEEMVHKTIRDFSILKIKTFSPSGKVVFSTDSEEVGEINRKSYFTELVAKGSTYTKLVKKDTRTLEDKVVPADVIETYVPVMRNGRFIGAFEIYYDITDRKERLDQLIIGSSTIIVFVTIILLGAVIFSSFKAKRANLDRKRAEHALTNASKLESVGRLAFGIAHEINNPLTNVSLGVQILKNRVGDNEVLRELESIEKNIEKASVIAKELLQFSRSDESMFINVDIIGTIKSTLILLEHRLRNVKVHLGLSDIPRVPGDPVKLEQVFINIIRNSVDALPDGGDIHISSSRKKGFVTVEVSDNGAGIADEDKQKLFEPFFTTKEVGRGSGLGLSICYSIIKQHNGHIEISSVAGKGTTVTIRLPVWEGHEQGSHSR